MTAIIKLTQHPIIEHSLRETGASVTKRLNDLNIENQVATEDTVKTLKALRAELNKEAKEFESQRKAIKEKVLDPYTDFENIYKEEIISKYKGADEVLKVKINDFEMKIKTERKASLEEYFKELVDMEQIDWLTFDRLEININLSTSEKKYKEGILADVQKIVDDIALISEDKHSAEMMVEYKKTLNVAQSIRTVRERKEEERIERERLKLERTNARKSKLQSMYFVFRDLTRTMDFIHDENVSIRLSDVEDMSDEEWAKRYAELEISVNKWKESQTVKAPTVAAPIHEESKSEQPAEKQEEVYEAAFSVTATKSELNKLSEFLKANNYNYKNI